MPFLDREIAAIVETFPSFDLTDLDQTRLAMDALPTQAPTWSDQVAVIEQAVSVAATGVDVPIRVYRPRRHQSGAATLYLHGGAFMSGGLESNHLACGQWSADTGIVVINVDYRLAPEHPYPAGLEDAYAVLEWAHNSAADLGLQPERIAVAGSSAGGGLAAALTLLAHDRQGPHVAAQVLFYPALDDRRDSASAREFTDTPIVDATSVRLMWNYYLNGQDADHYAAPARRADLRGLPRTYVLTCDNDPLRDEGIDYAVRLIRAGVPVELHHVPGSVHGFDVLPAALSERLRSEQTEIFRTAI